MKFSIPVSCYLQHRGERRGLGGIFFDDLNEYDQELVLGFSTGNSEHKYALTFILQMCILKVYDRGTTFGLQTGGRIESILVSLPLTARWEYGHVSFSTCFCDLSADSNQSFYLKILFSSNQKKAAKNGNSSMHALIQKNGFDLNF
ncbi:hypothetical protein BHE74_00017898 [Ensete ventricosum]|uniref:coproporphyrinogen oxidase n=1 Tax=Ensete ventricosum TaxID=4639 RepID=A0A444DZP5_ENSVE|nr:hypothetical protein GW17_00033212 [Ensete ventricosum]RWW74183.1 hypothetical protein BHE74_00017898 [Ensete ventricosum]RZR73977.1 hypothetical protein BHM03_00030344 [Ensete ventricosum]